MSNQLTNFLIELGENPRRLAAFHSRPSEVMQSAGLSATEQLAVASGRGARIRQAMNPEEVAPLPVFVQLGVASVRQTNAVA
jgi:hypothetical protein